MVKVCYGYAAGGMLLMVEDMDAVFGDAETDAAVVGTVQAVDLAGAAAADAVVPDQEMDVVAIGVCPYLNAKVFAVAVADSVDDGVLDIRLDKEGGTR